jgi:hypothetical protein
LENRARNCIAPNQTRPAFNSDMETKPEASKKQTKTSKKRRDPLKSLEDEMIPSNIAPRDTKRRSVKKYINYEESDVEESEVESDEFEVENFQL